MKLKPTQETKHRFSKITFKAILLEDGPTSSPKQHGTLQELMSLESKQPNQNGVYLVHGNSH